MPHGIRRVATAVFLLAIFLPVNGVANQVLLPAPAHLGIAGRPEWEIFRGQTPVGEGLRLKFSGQANGMEQALVIRQSDVKQDWMVELNGSRLGQLFLMEADVVHVLPVPPGAIREGRNELRISTRTPEDIVISGIELVDASREQFLSEARLQVTIRDGRDQPLPARITVLDENGFLAPLLADPGAKLAVRSGVIYTGDGTAGVGLPSGKYRIHATRGPEYSLGTEQITIRAGETGVVEMTLKREVSTEGWVAVDTHIHTLTLSRHGDATLQERMLTLAGEGVELAVCTEHNLHADYRQAAEALGVAKYFTSIPGNEVTTQRGHFNIFPVSMTAPPPDAKLQSWPELMRSIRSTPGVQVVVLNHPHDVHSGFTPMGAANFNPVTGKNRRGPDFSFDAMELINSGAMRSDWMEPVRTWFALLNRGYRITGIGASDSHDVSRFIVGQGRTYIRAEDSEPGEIDVAKACANLLAGRAIVSLGLFPELRVGGLGPGELVSFEKGMKAEARVISASWIRPKKMEFYANGVSVHQTEIDLSTNGEGEARLEWDLPERRQDYHLVMIATGPGVAEPYWGMARPYQPSSPEWEPVAIGITNPIWIDADGDGKFSSAREYAERLVLQHPELPALVEALGRYDQPVSSHAAELLEEQGRELRSPEVQEAVAKGAAPVRDGFALYLNTARR